MSRNIKIHFGPNGVVTSVLACVAACLSYHTNHSFGWSIVHFFCGVTYDVYWLFEYGHLLTKLGFA